MNSPICQIMRHNFIKTKKLLFKKIIKGKTKNRNKNKIIKGKEKKMKYKNIQIHILELDRLKMLLSFNKILKVILKAGEQEIKLKYNNNFMIQTWLKMKLDHQFKINQKNWLMAS